jgi:hypothetical protein
MKLGTENRTTVIVAAILGAIALFLVWRTFFTGGPVLASKPPAPVQQAAPAATPNGPAARRVGSRRRGPSSNAQQQPTLTASLDPRLRLDLLKNSESTEYKGAGRNIFRAESEPDIPKPVKNPVVTKNPEPTPPTPPVPQGPPPPPPIPLKFFGFANRPGEARQVFLLQGDDVFVAKEGEVISRRYKVVKINSNSVEIQDLLANNTQTIPLTSA